MAFFKFRKGADESSATAAQPESVEALRRRARQRLIGAAVLVLLGIVGFPLLFDTQPRPVAVDIPIEIPDRNKAKPLAPPAPLAGAPASGPAAARAPAVAASAAAPSAPVARAPAVSGTVQPAPAEAARVEAPKPAEKAEVAKAEPKAAARPAAAASAVGTAGDGARAQALLEGQAVQAAAKVEGRFVVQVGAFADAAKARETRQKVEKAGLKTYTHEAETKDGKRIRVRVGPFGTKAEAEKAAGRIKELDLPANVLTL